ncbi:MAG: nitroreductase family protein [Deltaproteobacteria bacterium]|nr:nitroreductase family protein [Deltaproteobacteria bacterium]
MMKELIRKNRSYRRFREDESVSMEALKGLVDLARLSPSSANLQPLRYILSNEAEKNALIFPHLKWAGYLKEWQGPVEGERPSAYIIVLTDTEISKTVNCDHGIAAQSILLGAVEQGLGGCILSSADREGLRKNLKIPAKFEILLVIALGRPKETVVIEEMAGGDVKYWRDEEQAHHVPKRKLSELILKL